MAEPSGVSEQEPAAVAASPALARAFRDAVRTSVRAQTAAAEDGVSAIHDELRQLSRRFVTLERQLLAETHRGDALRNLGDIAQNAELELERMLAVPGVRSVEVAGLALHVLTHPLRIEWQGVRYRLGAYRIVLDLGGDLRIESIDKLGPKPGWDHPHVQDGRPCLGNAREGIMRLIAEYELALAVQVAIGFLETYQPDSAYCAIERWPRAHVDG